MIALRQLNHAAVVILKPLILVHFIEHLLDAFGDFSIGASATTAASVTTAASATTAAAPASG